LSALTCACDGIDRAALPVHLPCTASSVHFSTGNLFVYSTRHDIPAQDFQSMLERIGKGT